MKQMRRVPAVLMATAWVAVAFLAVPPGCKAEKNSQQDQGAAVSVQTRKGEPMQQTSDKPRVRLKTSKGDILLELDRQRAPVTVENFLQYVKDGTYNGTIFHRVISGFMIQGGGFAAGMKEKQTRSPIRNEAGNGLKNLKGTIAMARTNVVDSATDQFFINCKDNDFLDHRSEDSRGFGYAVFGKVVKGIEVVEKIEKVPTGSKGMHQDVPVEDVVIQSAVIEAVGPK